MLILREARSPPFSDNIVDEVANLCQPMLESWLNPKCLPLVATVLHSSVSEPAVGFRGGGVDERDSSDEFSNRLEVSREGLQESCGRLIKMCREPCLQLLVSTREGRTYLRERTS